MELHLWDSLCVPVLASRASVEHRQEGEQGGRKFGVSPHHQLVNQSGGAGDCTYVRSGGVHTKAVLCACEHNTVPLAWPLCSTAASCPSPAACHWRRGAVLYCRDDSGTTAAHWQRLMQPCQLHCVTTSSLLSRVHKGCLFQEYRRSDFGTALLLQSDLVTNRIHMLLRDFYDV